MSTRTAGSAAPTVAEEYLRGATIILPQFHEFDLQPGRILPGAGGGVHLPHADQHLSDPAGPSDGAGNQGFPPHYDNHDVFVMQISGRQGLADLRHAGRDAVPRRAVRARPARGGRGHPGLHAQRRRLPLSAARHDARRRECRRRALAAHHRRPDHQDLGRPAARIDLRAGAELARFPPLAAGRLRRPRFRPRGGARPFRQADRS